MHQSVNLNSMGLFFRCSAHALIAALVIPAAYYSTQSGDDGAFTLNGAEAFN